ncbi:MAG TPA: hypothetical protein VK564_11895, partial [Thermodesulfobacteriota bacterium]|nr:hypothetical protein [Thermodesulfobacteriota bacterium]
MIEFIMPLFHILVPPLDQPLTYEIPEELSDRPLIGQRVLVPLKKKQVTGYIWDQAPEGDAHLSVKCITQVLDPLPLFPETMRPFFSWIAQYYLFPLGRVLKVALPAGLSVSSEERALITDEGKKVLGGGVHGEEGDLLRILSGKGRSLARLQPEERRILERLEARGWIKRLYGMRRETARPKKEKWIYPGPDFSREKFLKKDQALFEALQPESRLPLKTVSQKFSLSAQRLSTMVRKGLLSIREEVVFRNPFGEILDKDSG